MATVDQAPAALVDPDLVRHGPASGVPDRDRSSGWELAVGVGLLVVVAIGAFYFADRPRSTALDGWVFAAVPDVGRSTLSAITWFSRPAVIIVGPVLLAWLVWRRDRARAVACLVSPILALVTSELVIKPVVGRTLGGALTYPSGSTVGAAALAVAAVVATPAHWRVLSAAAATAYTLWMALAVVALRWHYPTDALAGVAYGAGVVLVVDGAAWRIAGVLRRRYRGDGPAGGRRAHSGTGWPLG